MAAATLLVHSKTTTALAPGQLGYSDLLTPKFEKFSLDYHLTPPGLEALKEVLTKKQDELLPLLMAEVEKANAEGAGFKPKAPVSIEEFLEGKLKEPHVGKPRLPQTPFIKIGCPPERRDPHSPRDKPVFLPVEVKAWDPANNLLDLAKLRMAAGTWLEPIVWVNMFLAKTAMGSAGPQCPCIAIKLVGVRVHELVQFGGGKGAPPPGADDAAIRAVMGSKFDPSKQDFSAFGLSASDAPHVDDHADDEPVDLKKSVF